MASKKADLFAPPSEQELKASAMFAPPSKDELISAGALKTTSPLEAAVLSGTNAMSFNLRPFAAGVGAGLGAASGSLDITQGKPLSDRVSAALDAASEAFGSARKAESKKIAIAEKEHPKAALGGSIVGAVASAPLIVGKGIGAAIKGGAATGAGKALSEADNLTDAATDILAGAGAGAAGYGLAKGVGAVAGRVAQSEAGQIAKEGFKALKELPKKVALKGGSMLTGVPEREIEVYSQQTDKINKLIADSGGNISEAADQVRQRIQTGVRKAKDQLNKQIGQALEAAPKEPNISTDPIIATLEKAKARLNPHSQGDAIGQIDGLIDTINKMGNTGIDPYTLQQKTGVVNLKDLQGIKNLLQDAGKRAYLKDGAVFQMAGEAQIAAKNATRVARQIIDPLAPEIKAANSQLSKLHLIEDKMNKNLISPEKPEAALLAAGGAPESRNARMLKRLGEVSGIDALGEAEQLAAAKRFGNASWTSADTTGKGVERLAKGSAIGFAVGGVPGAIVGGALTSPAALKVAINAGQIPAGIIKNIGGKVGKINDATIMKLYNYAQTPQGEAAIANAVKDAYNNDAVYRKIANDSIKIEETK